jgi:vacuolar-type H+-ATPase subunit D/Vma8
MLKKFPIKLEKNRAIIRFNRDFYDMFTISEVCESFQHLAKILVTFFRDENIIEVVLIPKVKIDLEFLALEFCNHCLYKQVMIGK